MYKIINIKQNMPNVDYALYLLDKEVMFATATKTPALIVIHGYGSKGEKGLIKSGVHKHLSNLKSKNKIIDFIAGEEWGEYNQVAVQMKALYPSLILCSQISNLNSGVTIVWICKNDEKVL